MKKTAKWKGVLVGIALVLTLAGCSGNGNNTASGAGKSNGTYPEKPIVVVAPSGPGGGWDRTARTFSKVMAESKLLDKTMTVENKPGGGGTVFIASYATQDVKNDYKLFTGSPPVLINNLKKEGNSPFGHKDTTPLAQLTKDYGSIVVRSDSKYNDLPALLEDLEEDPTSVTFAGGSGPGSMYHLVSILPAYKSGIDHKSIKYVSYDGTGEAMTALLGGNAGAIATDASSVTEYVKAGKVKVLAVAAPERIEGELSDVPTMKELGIDAEFMIWRGIFGPKEMSEEALSFWDDKIQQMVETEEWKKSMESAGWESDYKNSNDFKLFLDEQSNQIAELLHALDMAK
ncbi:tripartite tricarboxylate transporter substrate binding protein [Psychrobacillus sp. FSL K6-2684]|uniref:tripartite tricarboxylate transporter substrate binding protein n=1 Tax=unclassified Psychrobacillus TaxID=2636677 RepID=UPI001243A99C|nr:tripartite tricarboxylate transporter substrate binding protein [Psychrobacillus sp. AK 1817]QEY22980.1 tripartite tricarboxylate transporter substrate binding protein [Psychrobacillus sp. AK 1817]QGM31669.1 tripartite tricarboxylate transporter substrate binding protein [Bacillus sp. N3536]